MTPLRLVLAGAAIGNDNRGVDALARSVASAVNSSAPGTQLTILDDGWGVRSEASGHYTHCEVELVGARHSRRWHRPESWARVRLDLMRGGGRNLVSARLKHADAVLDISGGDSFTDLYGPSRFRAICAPKHAVLQARRPLVLLPQTIGPFSSHRHESTARRILRAATVAYARDRLSYERLLDLAGREADRSRLRQAVDIAFALAPAEPDQSVRTAFGKLSGEVIAGVNVSGLLVTPRAHEKFRLAGDYLATMTELVRRLVRQGARVVMLPHVSNPEGGSEDDLTAINSLTGALEPSEQERITILPDYLDACQLKWCVSQLDWLVGSRMHATVAGLSSLVPTLGYAYSDKAKGVFATCAMSHQVVDAREVSGEEAVQAMLLSFARREKTRTVLTQTVPSVNAQARGQLADLLSEVAEWRKSPVGTIA